MKSKLTSRTVNLALCSECEGVDMHVEHEEGKSLNWREEDELWEMVKPAVKRQALKHNNETRQTSGKAKGKNLVRLNSNTKCSHCHQNEGSSPLTRGLWE